MKTDDQIAKELAGELGWYVGGTGGWYTIRLDMGGSYQLDGRIPNDARDALIRERREKEQAEARAQSLEAAWMLDETIGITDSKDDGTLRPSVAKTVARAEKAEAERDNERVKFKQTLEMLQEAQGQAKAALDERDRALERVGELEKSLDRINEKSFCECVGYEAGDSFATDSSRCPVHGRKS